MADETGLIGCIEKREIKIVDYDTDWPKKFETHTRIIADALGGYALRIEHIGSTSVPGLAAKPIIDILVVVRDSADESTYLPQLEYERIRECQDGSDQKYYRRGGRSGRNIPIAALGLNEHYPLGFAPREAGIGLRYSSLLTERPGHGRIGDVSHPLEVRRHT